MIIGALETGKAEWRPMSRRPTMKVRGLVLCSEQPLQLSHIDGFHEMAVTTGVARARTVVLLAPSGQRDHFDALSRRLRTNLLCDFVPVKTRHSDVHENHCRLKGRRGGDGFGAAVGGPHLLAHQLQHGSHRIGRVTIVIDDQDSPAGNGSGRRLGRSL